MTAHKKNRFYIFSRRMPEDMSDKPINLGRDVINEKTVQNDNQGMNMHPESKNKVAILDVIL